jgi:hypothetical protein
VREKLGIQGYPYFRVCKVPKISSPISSKLGMKFKNGEII